MLKRKEFDATEEAALRLCVDQRFTMKQMVRRLGWSDAIIQREINRLGLRNPNMWSPEEDKRLWRLADTAEVTRNYALRCFEHRSVAAIKARAAKLGLKIDWSTREDYYGDAEDAVIRAHILKAPIGDWMHLLPGRTFRSIRDRGRLLGLKSPFIREKEVKRRLAS